MLSLPERTAQGAMLGIVNLYLLYVICQYLAHTRRLIVARFMMEEAKSLISTVPKLIIDISTYANQQTNCQASVQTRWRLPVKL